MTRLVTAAALPNAARLKAVPLVALAVLLLGGCPSSPPAATTPPSTHVAPAPTAPTLAQPRQPVSPPAPVNPAAIVGGGSSDGGALSTEEGERDLDSTMVTIRLLVEPAERAHVFWGVKDLGLAPLDLRRPRGSGPLDLVLRAPGYLTFHTRVFTDRDDRLSIRLVPIAEASGVFGYRAPATLDGM